MVRDRALDSWVVPGAEHQVRPVDSNDEHLKLLRAKLLEEVGEVLLAETREELIKELADVVAVLEGWAAVNSIDWDEVALKLDERELRSGGFTRGMVWETER